MLMEIKCGGQKRNILRSRLCDLKFICIFENRMCDIIVVEPIKKICVEEFCKYD